MFCVSAGTFKSIIIFGYEHDIIIIAGVQVSELAELKLTI